MYVKGMEDVVATTGSPPPSGSGGRPDAIIAIDIGTTLLKCILFDTRLEPQKTAGIKLNIIKQKERYSEIDPVHLNDILREALDTILEQKNNYRIRCLGVSTQRNSFVLWNRHTGETYTKFILWNDTRPIETCRSMNKSIKLNLFKMGAQVAAHVSTNQRIRQASKFKVEMLHVAPKLIEQLQILENKLGSDELKDVLYGTIDTWLIWNICKEKKFLSDVTCACCSGFYDIFYGEWSNLICSMFNIPKHILPQVTNNCYEFGTLKQDIVGVDYDIPMRSMIGDAQASFLAECAFTPGDCVITIGTGSFISVNIGNKAKCSKYDSYPLAGFFCDETQIYILHSPVCSAGVAIDWAKSVGLFDDYDQIENILQSTDSSNGVYFVPAFGLLEKSGTDDKSNIATGFIGLKQNTTKAEMLRAIIDSIAFSIKMRLEALFKDLDEHNVRLNSIRISGGVSRSNFLCQYLANLVNFEIEQSNFSYMSSGYGAAYAAALAAKMFDRVSDLKSIRRVTQVYRPDIDQIRRTNGYKTEIAQWERTVERFVKWNDKYYQ